MTAKPGICAPVLEERLRVSQKMEALGVLAGGIAHDFNNLLTAILGYADLALLEQPPASLARTYLQEVIAGARRAADLTQQLLAYAGMAQVAVRPLQLSELVRDMVDLLKVAISKKCDLRCHFAADLPLIEGDATELRQVIMNLIINASDALGAQTGMITVRTGMVPCAREALVEYVLGENLPEGDYVYLEVADTGSGMTAETQAKLFEPFFTTKFTGRGLGLSAVLGILHAHRGAIHVTSAPGHGTTVRVLFSAPRQAVVNRPTAPAALPAPAWRDPGTILVVDDEEIVREFARHTLENLGFTVLSAADGRAGVELYGANADRISAVLLDLTMPRLDGVETFHELRRLRADVRVILCSGYGDREASARLAGQGLAAFVAKPYGIEELRQALHQALQE